MEKFKFNVKDTYTYEDVLEVVKEHNSYMFKNEVAPLKDKLQEKSSEKDELEKEKTTYLKQVEKLTEELTPLKMAARKSEINKALSEAKLINPDKLQDAMKLADVTDEDTPESVLEKLKSFAEAREDFRFAEEDPKASKKSTSVAEAAAIFNKKVKAKEEPKKESTRFMSNGSGLVA